MFNILKSTTGPTAGSWPDPDRLAAEIIRKTYKLNWISASDAHNLCRNQMFRQNKIYRIHLLSTCHDTYFERKKYKSKICIILLFPPPSCSLFTGVGDNLQVLTIVMCKIRSDTVLCPAPRVGVSVLATLCSLMISFCVTTVTIPFIKCDHE